VSTLVRHSDIMRSDSKTMEQAKKGVWVFFPLSNKHSKAVTTTVILILLGFFYFLAIF